MTLDLPRPEFVPGELDQPVIGTLNESFGSLHLGFDRRLVQKAMTGEEAFEQQLSEPRLMQLIEASEQAIERALGTSRDQIRRHPMREGLSGNGAVSSSLDPPPRRDRKTRFDDRLGKKGKDQAGSSVPSESVGITLRNGESADVASCAGHAGQPDHPRM